MIRLFFTLGPCSATAYEFTYSVSMATGSTSMVSSTGFVLNASSTTIEMRLDFYYNEVASLLL